MQQSQGLKTLPPMEKIASATESYERIRRAIGPFMPVRKAENVAKANDWKNSDVAGDCCLKPQK